MSSPVNGHHLRLKYAAVFRISFSIFPDCEIDCGIGTEEITFREYLTFSLWGKILIIFVVHPKVNSTLPIVKFYT